MNAAELIGTPYRLRGTDPGTGFDCFTLVHYVRTRYLGLPTPVCSRRSLWQHCEPHLGCVVGLAQRSFGRLHHCGVLIDEGVLHALPEAGVMLTPLARLHEVYRQVECFDVSAHYHH